MNKVEVPKITRNDVGTLVVNIPLECKRSCPDCFWNLYASTESVIPEEAWKDTLCILDKMQGIKTIITSSPERVDQRIPEWLSVISHRLDPEYHEHVLMCTFPTLEWLTDTTELRLDKMYDYIYITIHSDYPETRITSVLHKWRNIHIKVQYMIWKKTDETHNNIVRMLTHLKDIDQDIHVIISRAILDVEPNSTFNKERLEFVTNILRTPMEAGMYPDRLHMHPCILAYGNKNLSCPAEKEYYEILNGELYTGCPYSCSNHCRILDGK